MTPPRFIPKDPPPMPSGTAFVNAMTVDVEDYFQVQALEPHYAREAWEACESRVADNTRRILDLFDAYNTKATFFTLGWVAQRHPDLMQAITDRGHELASHGMVHQRADSQTPDEFRADVRQSKALLEDTGGANVTGYRAATFSIGAKNMWAFDILAEEGFRYSSSINPVRHDNYGMPHAPRFPFYPADHQEFEEIPISTLDMFGQNAPCGGGGYFRLLPYAYFRHAIRQINETEGWPFMFYFHPWEIDPHQPRPDNVSLKSRFRHYTNLDKMEARLKRLLTDFSWGRVDETFLTPQQEPATAHAH